MLLCVKRIIISRCVLCTSPCFDLQKNLMTHGKVSLLRKSGKFKSLQILVKLLGWVCSYVCSILVILVVAQYVTPLVG